jgi:nitrite reductase (NADH) small subunit
MSELMEIESAPTQTKLQWIDICNTEDLIENTGICAVLPHFQSGKLHDFFEQLALFYLPRKAQVYVLSNWDPIGKANVMYRGIIGSIQDEPMVASPLYKQHFSLETGQCFEQNDIGLTVYRSRIFNAKVQITLDTYARDGQ